VSTPTGPGVAAPTASCSAVDEQIGARAAGDDPHRADVSAIHPSDDAFVRRGNRHFIGAVRVGRRLSGDAAGLVGELNSSARDPGLRLEVAHDALHHGAARRWTIRRIPIATACQQNKHPDEREARPRIVVPTAGEPSLASG